MNYRAVRKEKEVTELFKDASDTELNQRSLLGKASNRTLNFVFDKKINGPEYIVTI